MTDILIAVLFCLIGAMIVSIVWAFVDIKDHEKHIRSLQVDSDVNDSTHDNLWREVDRLAKQMSTKEDEK